MREDEELAAKLVAAQLVEEELVQKVEESRRRERLDKVEKKRRETEKAKGKKRKVDVTTSTDSVFTDVFGYSQYLIMPKHLSKELAEPMNINWKTSSQVSTGLRMDKCQSSTVVINKLQG